MIILGFLALIAYRIMVAKELDSSIYLLQLAGLCFLVGALMFLIPIVFAKKDKSGKVQLDPEKKGLEESAAADLPDNS